MVLMPFLALPKYAPEPIGCRFLSLGVVMRRREFIKALGASVAGWPLGAGAQTQPDQLRVETASRNARGQPPALTKSQSDALNTYNNAVNDFKSILGQRWAQINSNQGLPNLPGQALYLARIRADFGWVESGFLGTFG